MTQDEKWLTRFKEVKSFIEKNHRNPSRHRIEEHLMLNFVKHNRKLMNKGEMKEERVERFRDMIQVLFDLNASRVIRLSNVNRLRFVISIR